MKCEAIWLRSLIYACVLTLTACGGGDGSSNNSGSDPNPEPDPDPEPQAQDFTVGGVITGNTNGIALSLNGSAESFAGGNFTFTASLQDGEAYEVLFVAGGGNETCTVTNGSGTITSANVTTIDVTCQEIASQTTLQYSNIAILGGLASGDFNGDGNPDLAFSMRTLDGHPLGNNLYFMRFAFGNGLGGFASIFDHASECDRTLKRGSNLLAVDFTEDNFDDLVCRGGDTGLEVFHGANEPNTVFTTNTFEHGAGYFHAVDFNADGLPDIFDLGDDQGSPVVEPNFEYFLNDGTNDYGTIQGFAILNDIENSLGLAYGAQRLAIADVNGDSRDDLITLGSIRSVSDNDQRIAVFLGDTSGGFNLPTSATLLSDISKPTMTDEYRDLASGDFNADGTLDLAISHGTEFVQILLGDGIGGFTDQGRLTVGRVPLHIAGADFNGDGVLDLVTLNEDSHNLHIAYGVGDGTFGGEDAGPDTFLSIPLDNDINPYDLVIADFDGNALPDIAFAESAVRIPGPTNGNGSVQIFLNPGQ